MNGTQYPLGAVAPDWVRLRDATELPPGEADVVITVDGQTSRKRVVLPEGASLGETRVGTRDVVEHSAGPS